VAVARRGGARPVKGETRRHRRRRVRGEQGRRGRLARPVVSPGGGRRFTFIVVVARLSGALAAVKVHRSSERLHRVFHQELDGLQRVRHPHTVCLLAFYASKRKACWCWSSRRTGTCTSGSLAILCSQWGSSVLLELLSIYDTA
ncbi:unnamed protein product, partial [Urochloa humidicola]